MTPCLADPGLPRQRLTFGTDWKFFRIDPAPAPVSADSAMSGNPPEAAFDGNPKTWWHTPWGNGQTGYPHWLQRDLLEKTVVESVTLLPRQDGSVNGRIHGYQIVMSDDGKTWGAPAAEGELEPSDKAVALRLDPPATGRYLRLIVKSGEGGGPFASLAEMEIHGKGGAKIGMPGAKPDDDNFAASAVPDAGWETVNLPHTPVIESKALDHQWQGLCWYRRHFSALPEWKGRRVSVEFEAAMQVAEVFVNGKKVAEHFGGYLPFSVDLTDLIDYAPGADNVIAVRLDNRDNPLVPPGKPLASMDMTYQGGLYRDVWLNVTSPLHITNAVAANEVGGGGVFVKYPHVSKEKAVLEVQTHVINDGAAAASYAVETALVDRSGREVVKAVSHASSLEPGTGRNTVQSLEVRSPMLWHPDSPELYTLRSTVLFAGEPVDQVETRIGIRSIEWRTDGFFINGSRLVLNGANRHQDNIYIGSSAPNAMQWRDAWLLKNAGFNAIRAGHVPLDPAFLDACDELGLVVIGCTPGWQYFNPVPIFSERVYQNIRDMIRRDRNRPCMVLWETILNETSYPRDFALGGLQAANEELPGIATACDHGFPAAEKFTVNYKTPDGKMPLVTREWGDAHRYAGLNGGTWGDWGDRASEATMVYQAYARQRSLNGDDYWDWIGVNANPNTCGYFLWIGIDHNRGSTSQIAACGALGIDRYPKFSYYFHQSQRDPSRPGGAMVYVANYRTPASPADVAVFSNAEQVRLSLDGHPLATQPPDTTYTEAGKTKPIGHVAHPIFTFKNVPRSDRPLKAEALIGGRVVAAHVVTPPGPAKQITAELDHPGKPMVADGSDSGMLFLKVTDANGVLVPDAALPVTLEVRGPGRLIGQNPVTTEGGVAAIWVQAETAPGTIVVTAKAPGLAPVTLPVPTIASTVPRVPVSAGHEGSPRPKYETPRMKSTPTEQKPERARLSGVTVLSASSERPGFPAARGSDNDRETAWVARDEGPAWIVFDTGKVRTLKGSRIIWEKDSTWYNFTVEVSTDGSTWRQVHAGNESGQDFEPEAWSADNARYVRVGILSTVPGNSLKGIKEVELY